MLNAIQKLAFEMSRC